MNILKRLFTNERGIFKVVARGNGVISTTIKYSLDEAREYAVIERKFGRVVELFQLMGNGDWKLIKE